MRNRMNWITLVLVTALTVFSVIVVWPDVPKRYLPDVVDWPSGNGLSVFGLERREMKLGLDLKGGTYVLLEADTSRLAPGTEISDALEGVKDVLERRVNAFGVSETEITLEGSNRLAVQMPGIDPDEARELLGKTAQLEFLKPVRDDVGAIVCETPSGGTYAQPYQTGGLFAEDEVNDTVTCPPNAEGMVGVVVWEPATGTDSQGTERALTGSFLKANSRVEGPPPTVVIEFTTDGGLLFEQITTELVGLPLAIFLDEEMIGAPTVSQPIAGAKASMTGLNEDEARILAIQLNSGALPVPVNVIDVEETL